MDSRVHGTTGEIPLQALKEEKLWPLPSAAVLEKYCWETRIVTRDGLVSFDGIRYGVPWQYGGKEVRVRLCGGSVEIYYGETRIAAHEARYSRGRIVWLPGQYTYTGLSERNGIAAPPSQAHRDDAGVEVRRLSVYDELIEVASNG